MKDIKETGTATKLLQVYHKLISNILVKEAQNAEDKYEECLRKYLEEHPDHDHKDARWEDVDTHGWYLLKNTLWELVENIYCENKMLGIEE